MPSRTGSVEKKPWSFLVYMAGDNSLENAGLDDLAEMKKVGTQAGVNVVAQFDRPAGATRYGLQKGTSLAQDAVATLGRQNTGSPAALIEFLEWGVAAYPADRYALVLWNHGQGWDDTDIYGNDRSRDARRPKRIGRAFFRTSVEKAAGIQKQGGEKARAILLDDGAKDFLDNLEMKEVLAAARKLMDKNIDLFGMDACLMSMVEVGYQSRGAVDFSAGSEEEEPGDGWPYDAILRLLAAKPDMTGEALGKAVVDSYLRSYKGGSASVTQSLCKLAGAPAVAGAVKALGAALTTALGNRAALSAINDARNRVQAYTVRDNVDLVDLCRLLGGLDGIPPDVKQASQGVINAVLPPGGGAYVAASGWEGDVLKNSNGAAIYFPTVSVSPLYAGLDWAKDTGWGTFLEAYVAAIHRR
jgi:Clostripain family